MSDQPGTTPPGWYPDPSGAPGQRYWDGLQWTDHAAPPPGGAGGTGQTGGAGIRFASRFLDAIIVGIPLFVLLAVFGLDPSEGGGAQFLSGIVGSIAMLVYYVVLEASTGQTLGKKILGLRTVGVDGQPISQDQALRRNAWTLVGILPVLGGLLSLGIAIWIAVTISSTGRGVHDGWGDTMVVRTG